MFVYFLILAIALDKFLAIHWPFRYTSMVTTRSTVYVSLIINVYAIVLSVVPLAGYNRYSPDIKCVFDNVGLYGYIMFLAGNIIIYCILIAIIYTIIGRTAVHHMQRIADTTFTPQLSIVDSRATQQSNIATLRTNIKAINNLTLVVGAFTVCCVPYAIFLLVVSEKSDQVNESSFRFGLRLTFLCLFIVNSGMNPVIYAFKFPQYSKSFKRLLFRMNPM